MATECRAKAMRSYPSMGGGWSPMSMMERSDRMPVPFGWELWIGRPG